jgi:hypothetical protein
MADWSYEFGVGDELLVGRRPKKAAGENFCATWFTLKA